MTFNPPALVEMLPPMVQVPSDASDSGNRRSAASAAACASPSVTPDSQVITLLSMSTSRIARRRWVEMMISLPLKSGVWPPTRPVLPPCGTMRDSRLVAEGRDVRDFPGRARPHQRKRHSLIKLARLDERAREQRRVRQHVTRAHDVLQAGHNSFSFRRVHLEEPPRPRLFRPAKEGGDFDMSRKAKLVKRGHRLKLKAAVDENARVAGEGRRIARDGDNERHS